MGNWSYLALVCGVVGYDADVLGLLSYQTQGQWGQQTVALLIVAFVLYTISTVLLVLNKLAGLAYDIITAIVTIVFMLAAAGLLIAAVGVYEDKRYDTWTPRPYCGVLEISSAACALLVVLFLCLQLIFGRKTTS